MSRCVLDASIALAWILPGESHASNILEQVAVDGAVVPGLWALEVGHVLLTAERRGRISMTERQSALELLSALQIDVDTGTASRAWSETLALAETHGLTLYDASYLEASIRLALPLASRDGELIRAATACGVRILT